MSSSSYLDVIYTGNIPAQPLSSSSSDSFMLHYSSFLIVCSLTHPPLSQQLITQHALAVCILLIALTLVRDSLSSRFSYIKHALFRTRSNEKHPVLTLNINLTQTRYIMTKHLPFGDVVPGVLWFVQMQLCLLLCPLLFKEETFSVRIVCEPLNKLSHVDAGLFPVKDGFFLFWN